MYPILMLSLSCIDLAPTDWPEILQKPYAKSLIPDLGLKPLLITRQGNKITTKEDWAKARKALEEAWLEQLGKPPVKPNRLNVRIEETKELESYARQLLSFSSEGDDRIRAYLLTPTELKPKEKRPVVVVFHSTTKETLKEPTDLGKDPERAYALHLVRRGYITLCPECYILKDPNGWAVGQAKALEKRRPGWTGLGKMTFDASRCIDFLETLPTVDKDRIGCLGFSLGAKEVLYAMAFESRYKVGVFNEGGIGLRMSNWTDPWYLTENIKRHIPEMEHHQLLALIAPRPFLVLGGDAADGDASWPLIDAALPVYKLRDGSDRIGLFNHNGKHSFPPEARKLAYAWLDSWLGLPEKKD